MIKHKDYCSRCKTGKAEIKHCINNKTQYYYCRSCNTKRCAKYRKTENGADKMRQAVYRSIKKHPEKQKARVKVMFALKNGVLIKPEICEMCNKLTRIEGHHLDYNKPLEVMWICRTCHSDLHKFD